MLMTKPLVLVIRDGWGYNPRKTENAEFSASTPNTDELMRKYPNVLIGASGEYVGLPKGYEGNSEVGHGTIGSGRIMLEPLVKINKAIKSGEFFKVKAFLGAIKNCRKYNTKLHIIGLLQSEGVHSHENHLYALLDLCKKQRFRDVVIHAITDGRDSPVNNGIKHIQKLQNKIKKIGFGKIVTISGRYYTMDRDERWKRTKKAYDCIVDAKGAEFNDVVKQIKQCYAKNETDEFIVPRKIKGYNGMQKNDSVIFFNYRTDRPRELTEAIVEKKFKGWKRKPRKVYYVAMTRFYTPMNAHVGFEELSLKNLFGKVVADNGLKQLRISETEKYAHVTFFFNGQNEKPNKNEDRILVHSPMVPTYDLKPEMSVYKITNKLLENIGKYDFIVVNLVNGDMVGHTGVWKACLKAVETVDDCVGKIVKKVLDKDGVLFIFADHGNVEDQSKRWRTSHTLNKVPFILVSNDERLQKAKLRKGCGLSDIAPTALKILGIKKPKEMSGKSIII